MDPTETDVSGCEFESSGPRQEPMASGNENSDFIKCREFLEQLTDSWLLKDDSACCTNLL
jgi:hypothetical protein